MNLKWLPALALATQLHAAMVDLPQGSQIWQQKDYSHSLHYFDEFLDGKWVGGGDINGGTLFNTDLSTLWWNFPGSEAHIRYVVINDGQDSCKIVNTTGKDIFQGNLILTAFDGAPVQRVDLYGRLSLPEEGMTVTLLVLSLIFLLAFYDQKTIS